MDTSQIPFIRSWSSYEGTSPRTKISRQMALHESRLQSVQRFELISKSMYKVELVLTDRLRTLLIVSLHRSCITTICESSAEWWSITTKGVLCVNILSSSPFLAEWSRGALSHYPPPIDWTKIGRETNGLLSSTMDLDQLPDRGSRVIMMRCLPIPNLFLGFGITPCSLTTLLK